jgi:hypothetical protein
MYRRPPGLLPVPQPSPGHISRATTEHAARFVIRSPVSLQYVYGGEKGPQGSGVPRVTASSRNAAKQPGVAV